MSSHGHTTYKVCYEDAYQAPYDNTEAWVKHTATNHALRTNSNPPTPEEVGKYVVRLFTNTARAGGMGTLVKNKDETDSVFHLVFNLRKYVAPVDEAREELDESVWGVVDEVTDGLYQLTDWTVAEYKVEPAMNVYKYEQHHDQLVANASITSFMSSICFCAVVSKCCVASPL